MPSGIYAILNLVTGQAYVGSSVSIMERLSCHLYLLNKNQHTNPYLQRAWNLYGSYCFSFVIIELTPASTLIDREEFYLNSLDRLYNISKKADRPPSRQGWKHSAETITRLQVSQKARRAKEAEGKPVKSKLDHKERWTPDAREKARQKTLRPKGFV